MDEFLFSFGQACIYSSDLDLCKAPSWFNDALITVYQEYMAEKYTSEKILHLSPSIVMLLKHASFADANELLLSSSLSTKEIIFLPLNDSSASASPQSGTHWSLIAYLKSFRTFVVADSLRNANEISKEWKRVMEVLDTVCCNEEKEEKKRKEKNSRVKVVVLDTPKQQNPYDCGPFVLCSIEFILNQWKDGVDLMEAITHKGNIEGEINGRKASEIRSTIETLILNKVKELEDGGK